MLHDLQVSFKISGASNWARQPMTSPFIEHYRFASAANANNKMVKAQAYSQVTVSEASHAAHDACFGFTWAVSHAHMKPTREAKTDAAHMKPTREAKTDASHVKPKQAHAANNAAVPVLCVGKPAGRQPTHVYTSTDCAQTRLVGL